MQSYFDSVCAEEAVKNVLDKYCINHDGNADQSCAIESAMVIEHLDTLLKESNALLKQMVSAGFSGMSDVNLAEWLGTAEGTLNQSKYLMPKDSDADVDAQPAEFHGENIISMHHWAKAKKTKDKNVEASRMQDENNSPAKINNNS